MELFKQLPGGEVMSICTHCKHMTHPFTGRCNSCGGQKEYDYSEKFEFEFLASERKRSNVRETLSDKTMSKCMTCNRVTHTFNKTCTSCGGSKEYQFFFGLSKKDRENVLRILNEFHYNIEN